MKDALQFPNHKSFTDIQKLSVRSSIGLDCAVFYVPANTV